MNDSRLTDLDELIETVRNKTSQTYILEAISAYRGGAYRAAIVSTWIAVVYDIIAKLRELSEGGDRAASQEIEKVDNSRLNGDISGMTTFEYSLLKTVYKEPFEFLTKRELIDLERLKEDRHACAHPAFIEEDRLFQPTPEVVRTHIVHTILYLLQHGPVQGKFALEAIMDELKQISGSTDVKGISERLSGRYFNTAKEVLIRNLSKVLVKELLRGADSEFKGREKRRTLVHTLIVIAQQYWDIYEATTQEQIHKIAKSLEDKQLMPIFHLLKEDRSTWSRIEKGLQRRIKDALKSIIEEGSAEETDMKIFVDYEVFDSINIPDPEIEHLIKETFKKLDQRTQESVINQTVYPPHPMFVDKAVEIYIHSSNPYSATDIGEKLLPPLIPYFTPEHIQCLLHDGVQKNESILDAENILEFLEVLFDKSLTYFEEIKPAWQKLISYLDSIEDIQNPVKYQKLREKFKRYKIISIYGDTNEIH